MTFDQIVNEVMQRCSLTSPDAADRVLEAVIRHYRRITSLLGLEVTRVRTVNAATTLGSRSVTVLGVEKIDRVFDVTDPVTARLLTEVTLHRQRVTPSGSAAPNTWAMAEANAASVVILLDTTPQVAYALQVDGWTTRADPAGGGEEPMFPASFHDVLTWFALAEELLKKEKFPLAKAYEQKAETLLADLRFHLADTHTRELRQNDPGATASGMGGGGGGGGVPHGGSSYTQTGDLTFHRPGGPDIPPFFVDPSNNGVVANLNADLLDGETGADYHDLANAIGNLPVAQLPTIPLSKLEDIPSKTIIARDAGGAGPPSPVPVDQVTIELIGDLHVKDLGITGAKLADDAVSTSKIVNNAITAAKILDDQITAIKLHAAAGPGLFGRPTAGAGQGSDIPLLSSLAFSGGSLKVNPAGSDKEFQFNDATVLAASSGFSWDKTNGALNYPGNPRCLAYSTGFTPVTSAYTVIPFANEDYDIGNIHSTVSNTSRLTIPAGFGGLWLFGATTWNINATGGGPGRLQFRKNGAATAIVTDYFTAQTAAAVTGGGNASFILPMAAGDYLEFFYWQANTNPIGGAARDQWVTFWCVRLMG